MDFKLNFKLDEPSLNNHIYKKDIFVNMMREAMNTTLYVYSSPFNDYETDIEKIVGIVNSFKIEEDNSVYVDIRFIKNKFNMILFHNDIFNITTASIGKLNKGLVVDDKTKLQYLYFVRKDNK